MLADVSVEYYAKLERGSIAGASASVLESLARALRLDDTERAHLFDLARAADGIPASGRPRKRATATSGARLSLQWVLEAITEGVAFVRDPYEELAITAEPGLVLMVYTAEPGSPSVERLRLLASWGAGENTAAERHRTG